MLDDIKPPNRAGKLPPDRTKNVAENNEPEFVPPEEVAETETSQVSHASHDFVVGNNKSPKTGKRSKRPHPIKWWKSLNKRQRLTAIVAGGIFAVGATHAGLAFFVKAPPAPAPVNIVIEPEPEDTGTEPSRLTGVEIPRELNKLPVTAVMIENSPDARPQSGLIDAGIVFEAISEGGITRFCALFLESKPSYIGPVRSVRPYYIDFFRPFDAAIAHAGGSALALAQIRSQKIKDLDHGANPSAYHRVSSRFAPHNLYTSRNELLAVHKARGYTSSKFDSFPRKEDSPLETPLARKISLDISSFNYNPIFNWDAKTNTYPRTMAGRPHVDEKSKKQIAPKVLVVIETSHHYEGIYSIYGMKGSGKVYVFQDGNVITGTWKKNGRTDMYRFLDQEGKPIELNAGQTWISLVEGGGVSFAP